MLRAGRLGPAGGTLCQDLADDMPGSITHDYVPFSGGDHACDFLAHEVHVTDGTRLAEFVGAGAAWQLTHG